jgi:hypothetical protein
VRCFPYCSFTWSITCYPWVHVHLLTLAELPVYFFSTLTTSCAKQETQHRSDTTFYSIYYNVSLFIMPVELLWSMDFHNLWFSFCFPSNHHQVSLSSDWLDSDYKGLSSVLGEIMWDLGVFWTYKLSFHHCCILICHHPLSRQHITT